MKITEKELEDIIYQSPWLLSEKYIIPKISGSRGENGRQINIGENKSRFIDLLFKDITDERPILIELKKGKLIRENVAQILEYRGMIISMPENQKEEWENEFGKNYFSPKMVLIGSEVDDETMISANLSGIEIRTFGKEPAEIGTTELIDIKTKINEWNAFRSTGNRTLIEREDWITSVVGQIHQIVIDYGKGFYSNPKPAKTTEKNSYLGGFAFPFLDLKITKEDETILGIYEYCDEDFPFSESYFYLDYHIDENIELSEEDQKKIQLSLAKFNFEQVHSSTEQYNSQSFKIKRSEIEGENLKPFIHKILFNAMKIKSVLK